MSKIKEDRFEPMFEHILTKRILPLVQEKLECILDESNFTHFYSDEIDENGDRNIRPIFSLNSFDVIIVCLIIDELHKPDFIDKFQINVIPINESLFFNWLQMYLFKKNLIFHITTVDPDTKESTHYAFFGSLKLDFSEIKKKMQYYLENNNPL